MTKTPVIRLRVDKVDRMTSMSGPRKNRSVVGNGGGGLWDPGKRVGYETRTLAGGTKKIHPRVEGDVQKQTSHQELFRHVVTTDRSGRRKKGAGNIEETCDSVPLC